MVSVKELIREKNAMKEQLPSAGQRNKDMKTKTPQNLVVKKEEEMTTPVVKKEEEITMMSSVKRLIREKEAMREAEQNIKDSKEERREKRNKWKVERLLQPSVEQDKDMSTVPKVEGDTTATINMKQLIREREEREAAREQLLSAEKTDVKNKMKMQTKTIKIENMKDMTTEDKVLQMDGELTQKVSIKQLIRDKEAMIMNNEMMTTGDTVQRIKHKRMKLRNKLESEKLQLISTEHKDDMNKQRTIEKKEEMTTSANVKQLISRKSMTEDLVSADLKTMGSNVETIKYNVKQLIREREAMEDEQTDNREEWREERLLKRIQRREVRLQRVSAEQNKDMDKLKKTEKMEEDMKTMVNVKQRIREKEPLTDRLLSPKQEMSEDIKKERREKKRLQWIPSEQNSDMNKTKSTTECRLLRMEEEWTEMSNVKQLVRQREVKRLAAAQHKQCMKNETSTTDRNVLRLKDKVKGIMEKREERNLQLIPAELESPVTTVQLTGEREVTAEQLLSAEQENEDVQSETKTTEDDSVKMEEKMKHINEEREDSEKLEERFDLISVERHKDMKTTETIEEEVTIIINVIGEEEAKTEHLHSAERNIGMENDMKTTEYGSGMKTEETFKDTKTTEYDSGVKTEERFKDMKEQEREDGDKWEEERLQRIPDMNKMTTQNKLLRMEEEIESTTSPSSVEQENEDVQSEMETEDDSVKREEEIKDLKEERREEAEEELEERPHLICAEQKNGMDNMETTENMDLNREEDMISVEQTIDMKVLKTTDNNALRMETSTEDMKEGNRWEGPLELVSSVMKMEEEIEAMDTLIKQPIEEKEKLTEQLIEEKEKVTEQPIEEKETEQLLSAEPNNIDKDQMETSQDKLLEMEGNIEDIKEERAQELNQLQLITAEQKATDTPKMTEKKVLEQQIKHIKEDQREEDRWQEENLKLISSAEQNNYMSTKETPEDIVLHMNTMKTLEDFVQHMMKTPEDGDLKWQEKITTMKTEEKFEDIKEESNEENLMELDMEQEMRAMLNVEQLIKEGEAMTERLLYAEQKIKHLKDFTRTENNVPEAEENIEDLQKEMREMGNQWEERLQLLSAEHNNYMNKIKITEQEVLKMQKEMTTIVNLAQRIREQEARAEQWFSAKENVKDLKNHIKKEDLAEEIIKDIKEERTEEERTMEVSLQHQVIREKEETKEKQYLEKKETSTMVNVVRLTDNEAVTEQLLLAEGQESLQHQVVREKESGEKESVTEEKIEDIEEERTEEASLQHQVITEKKETKENQVLEKEEMSMMVNVIRLITDDEALTEQLPPAEEESLQHQVIREKEERTGSKQLEKEQTSMEENKWEETLELVSSVIKIEENIEETLIEQPIEERETLIVQPIEEETEEGTESKQLEKEQTSIMVNRRDVPHQNDVHPNAGGPPDAGETGGPGGGVDAATGGSVTELVNVVRLITGNEAMTDQLLSAKQESLQHQVIREKESVLTEEKIKDIEEERTEKDSNQHQVIGEKEKRTESKQPEKEPFEELIEEEKEETKENQILEKEQTSMEVNKWEETLELVPSVIKMEEEIEETLTEQPIEEIQTLMKQPLEEENNETKKKQVVEKDEISMTVDMVQLITDNEAMTEQLLSAKQEDKLISAGQTDDMNDIKTTEEHNLLNIKEDLREATELDENWTTQFCQLTLDPNTVNNNLSLSENNRRLTNVRDEQTYPYHPERFDSASQVLCRQGLTGCCYWEVEWREQASIALAYRGISRTGHNDDCLLGYNDMSWSLDCYEVRKSSYEGLQGNRYIVRHDGNTTIVPDGIMVSNRVGVFLDWSAGILSFYSVSSDTRTHLYTFQTTFTQPLYCAFWCWMLDASVTLCQIEQ